MPEVRTSHLEEGRAHGACALRTRSVHGLQVPALRRGHRSATTIPTTANEIAKCFIHINVRRENKMKELNIRKPLEPIDDNAECKLAYELLLEKYEALEHDRMMTSVGFGEEYPPELCSRAEAYAQEREDYNQRFAGHIETIEMVKAKIKRLNAESKAKQKEYEANVAKMEQKLKEKWPNGEPDFNDLERYGEWANDQFELMRLQQDNPMVKTLSETSEEESKFKELQDEANARFEYVAKHLTPGEKWLSDEEVAQRENGKEV